MHNKFYQLLQKHLFIALLLGIITTGITAQSYFSGVKTFGTDTVAYTHYNNYVIFKQSFFHLIEQKDLYKLYPEEHWDLYKYSPSFSLLMAPFAALPDLVGLLFWNLLNVMILFFALWKLPFVTPKIRLLALGFIIIELITSLQNSQSNALIAGLIIFAFLFLEKRNIALASLFIVLTVFIKIFGLVAFSLFLFYPDKIKSALYTIGWVLLFAVLPLLVTPLSQLIFQYQSWLHLLQNDHSASFGLSVAGWLQTWFGVDAKNLIVIIGVILFCLPFINYKYFNELKFKLFFLSSILIWIIIFNHKAESATFIIAVSGISIWFFSQKFKTENLIFLLLAFVFTILSPTDLFPKSVRVNFVVPYVLKAVPCILIWVKIIFDLVFYKSEHDLKEGIV